MDQQLEDGLPHALPFIENVEGKETQKRRKQDADHPRRPEKKTFYGFGHGVALLPLLY